MKLIDRSIASVFGLCVIIVSLCSGCASSGAGNSMLDRQLAIYDLVESFPIDCRKKQEQIRFMQSLRPHPDDRLFTFGGWMGLTEKINFSIDTNLRYLANYC